jgi:hypothetical protein
MRRDRSPINVGKRAGSLQHVPRTPHRGHHQIQIRWQTGTSVASACSSPKLPVYDEHRKSIVDGLFGGITSTFRQQGQWLSIFGRDRPSCNKSKSNMRTM